MGDEGEASAFDGWYFYCLREAIQGKVLRDLGKVRVVCSVCSTEFMGHGPETPGGDWMLICKKNLNHDWRKGVQSWHTLCSVCPLHLITHNRFFIW